MPEDGQNDRNKLHVLTGLIKFAMADGIGLSVFNLCVRLWGFGAEVLKTRQHVPLTRLYGVTTQDTAIPIIRVDKKG